MKRLILAMFFFLAACAPATPSANLPVFLGTATAYIAPSYPSEQAAVSVPNQEASGIQVSIDRVWREGKNLNASVCFTLPDASDWAISEANLNYGGTVLQEFGTTLVNMQEPAAGQAGSRCDTLTFVVAPDADLSTATITINAIASYPREGEYCSVYMPKIQQALEARGIGITLECVDVNGTPTMQISSRPADMTQERAEQIVYSDEFYTIKGPWTFTFNLGN